MRAALFLVSASATLYFASADLILYSDDFETTPPGWFVKKTNPPYSSIIFTSQGVHLQACSGLIDFQTDSLVVVPDGTDHLHLSASQTSLLCSTQLEVAFVFVRMGVNGVWPEEYIYSNYAYGGGRVLDDTPIDVILQAEPGSVIGFQFRAGISYYAGHGEERGADLESNITLTDFVLTAVGDIGFDQETWGGMKTLYR